MRKGLRLLRKALNTSCKLRIALPENGRFVFAQISGGQKREYKVTTMALPKAGTADPNSLSEFQKLLGENYQVKDLFYSGGLNVILEK